jgi:hypothetical protein
LPAIVTESGAVSVPDLSKIWIVPIWVLSRGCGIVDLQHYDLLWRIVAAPYDNLIASLTQLPFNFVSHGTRHRSKWSW